MIEISVTPINVFIISGFLGAGKTTILNCFLQQFENQKNVVIENEVGKVNIDSSLLKYKIELVVSDDNTKGLPSYWTNLGFEAYVKDTETRNRFEFLDYIIMKEKVSEIENWVKI